jgi:hypothetical protein
MPVPMMVRVDDDLAIGLREKSEADRRSINRLINDFIRVGLASGGVAKARDAETEQTRAIIANFETHLKLVRRSLKPLDRQETQQDYNEKMRVALETLTECVGLLARAVAPDTIPVVSSKEHAKTLA